jgi:hypothetical protein
MGQVEMRKRRSRRRRTYIWALSGLAVVSSLIYWEQTALLFVLSTLAICVLLILVAFADLEGIDKELHKQPDNLNKADAESNPTTGSPVPALTGSSVRNREKGAA